MTNYLELLYLISFTGILAVAYSYLLSGQIISASPGNSRMQEIAEAIQIGAKAYLNRQYKTIAVVGIIVLAIVSYFFSYLVGLGYFIGAFLSGVAGYVGMLISVKANVRTAEASRQSLQSGLTIAFKSGGGIGGRPSASIPTSLSGNPIEFSPATSRCLILCGSRSGVMRS